MMNNLDNTLNWEVKECPIYDMNGNEIKGYKRLENDSTGATLNICKASYVPVRNEQLIESANLVSERTGLELEGFASFRDGQRVMAYLKNPNAQSIGGYKSDDYMIIGNSHNYSTSFFTGLTSRVHRCENMFSATNQQSRIQHTKQGTSRITDLMEATTLYFNSKTGLYEEMETFSGIKTNPKMVETFTRELLALPMSGEIPTRTQNRVSTLNDAIKIESAAFGNNLLGLFNGVTRYTTHDLKKRNSVFGNPFGRANELNQRALNLCRTLKDENPNRVFSLKGRF